MRSRRVIRVGLLALLAAATLAVAPPPASAEDVEAAYAASAMERDLARLLSGRHETGAFVFQFRPGSAAESGRAAIEPRLAAALAKAAKRLDLKPRKLRVFLYDTAQEMSRLTGRPSSEACAIGDTLHVAIDRPVFGPALARALELQWGQAGDKLGGGFQGGRWYKLNLRCLGGKLTITADDRKVNELVVNPKSPGGIAFGVEDGRMAVRGLKLRAADATGSAAWTFPLRGAGAEKAWTPEVPGRWRVADDEIEGTNHGRLTLVRFAGLELKDVELECEVRLSEGAGGEIAIHAPSAAQAGPGGTRLMLRPGAIIVRWPEGARRATGPGLVLREALAEAMSAVADDVPVETLARVVIDQTPSPTVAGMRLGLPADGMERYRSQVVVGAFALHVLETLGPAKFRELYFADPAVSPTPIGVLADVEVAWRKSLKAKEFPADALRAAERRIGVDVFGDGKKFSDLTPGLKSGAFKVEGGGKFTPGDHGLRWFAAGTQGTNRAFFPDQAPAKAVVRASVMLDENSRLRIALKGRDGSTSGALLSAKGAQLVTPDNTVAAKSDFGLDPGRFYDVAVAFEGAAARVYVDGELAAEAAQGMTGGPGKLAFELEGRRLEVRSASVRTLD